ncbi:hypothetical protein C2E23DRAFT_158683 [Lenzites betulinus]|nr:hypothetical protein C2E23DRAFT_158683 [Lenzites betulinus]
MRARLAVRNVHTQFQPDPRAFKRRRLCADAWHFCWLDWLYGTCARICSSMRALPKYAVLRRFMVFRWARGKNRPLSIRIALSPADISNTASNDSTGRTRAFAARFERIEDAPFLRGFMTCQLARLTVRNAHVHSQLYLSNSKMRLSCAFSRACQTKSRTPPSPLIPSRSNSTEILPYAHGAASAIPRAIRDGPGFAPPVHWACVHTQIIVRRGLVSRRLLAETGVTCLCAHIPSALADFQRGQGSSAFRLLWVDFMCVHRGSLIAPSFLNRFICSSPDPGGIRSRALVLSTPSPQPPILLSAACSVSAVASRRRHSTPRDLFRRFSPRCCPPSSDGVYFSKSHTC